MGACGSQKLITGQRDGLEVVERVRRSRWRLSEWLKRADLDRFWFCAIQSDKPEATSFLCPLARMNWFGLIGEGLDWLRILGCAGFPLLHCDPDLALSS